jgi:tetratricopeptide (TPR) repeat protein
MKTRIGLLLLALVVAAGWMKAQVPQVTPLTQKEVVDLLKGKGGPQQAAVEINQRGVDFELTPDIEKKLRKAKADDAFINLVKNSSPQARAARAELGGAYVPSPAENQAFRSIQDELVPEKALQLVEEFVKTYPKSMYLSYAYVFGANACQQKGDLAQVLVYLDKSLEANPDNIPSLIMKATLLPQPQMLKGGDDVKVKRLTGAEEAANKALKLIEQLPKNPQETDEGFAKRKAVLGAGAHAALGMTHLQRALMGLEGPDKGELAKAEQEYRTAVTSVDNPTPDDFFRLGETLVIENKLPQALAAFTKASELGAGIGLKAYADQRIEEIKKKNPQVQSAPQP